MPDAKPLHTFIIFVFGIIAGGIMPRRLLFETPFLNGYGPVPAIALHAWIIFMVCVAIVWSAYFIVYKRGVERLFAAGIFGFALSQGIGFGYFWLMS